MLIITMFHSVPPCSAKKMERFGGFRAAAKPAYDSRLKTFDLTLPRPLPIIQYRPGIKKYREAHYGKNMEPDIDEAASF